jgi:hypothetical protein
MTVRIVPLSVCVALLAGCAGAAPPTAAPPTAKPATPPTATPAAGAARAEQLNKLQTLLRDPAFALDMAQTLDASYYRGQGQPVPAFLKPEEETATAPKSVKEEKIAINLAGFYAVEVGVGYLAERDKQAPLDVLEAVAKGSRANADMLLLARFANATWKAGQPFRALNRITRDTFGPAGLLTEVELKKDFDQIKAAAAKLAEKMQDVKGKDSAAQLAGLQTLLRDSAFALEMAQALDAAYYVGQGQPVPAFLKPEEETATTPKSVKEEKIAINLAGFYALEAGIGVISERGGETPLQILDGIVKGTRSADEMTLLARFANATWKAGQPFRGLSRITRDTFKPAALLSTDDVKKDLDQIQAAAAKLAEAMRK